MTTEISIMRRLRTRSQATLRPARTVLQARAKRAGARGCTDPCQARLAPRAKWAWRKERMRRHGLALLALTIALAMVWAPFIGGRADGGPHLTMRWDFYWQYSRWLIYLSDSLHAGIFPLWCPYVGGGVPFFLNPQAQLHS